MDSPLPWWQYVEAVDLAESGAALDGLEVMSPAGDKLGTVDGFIIDGDTGRPYYLVVDSGGHFAATHYLLPIGHTSRPAGQALMVNLTRERIECFPEFDKSAFDTLSHEQLEQLDLDTAAACCPTETAAAGPNSWADRWEHYTLPDWWIGLNGLPAVSGRPAITASA